jgi:hypothetical protein
LSAARDTKWYALNVKLKSIIITTRVIIHVSAGGGCQYIFTHVGGKMVSPSALAGLYDMGIICVDVGKMDLKKVKVDDVEVCMVCDDDGCYPLDGDDTEEN